MSRSTLSLLLALAPAAATAGPPLTPSECWEKYGHDVVALEACLGRSSGPTWYDKGEGTCLDQSEIRPCDGEEDHWIAYRFEPPSSSSPFRVTRVRYSLYHGLHRGNEDAMCSAAFAHRVQLLVGSSTTPDADPVVVASWTEPAALVVSPQPFFNTVVFDRAVPTTVEIGAGDYLFVSIQNTGEVVGSDCSTATGTSLCATACSDGADATFWSFSAEPDYSWASMEEIEISWGMDVGVEGYHTGYLSE